MLENGGRLPLPGNTLNDYQYALANHIIRNPRLSTKNDALP